MGYFGEEKDFMGGKQRTIVKWVWAECMIYMCDYFLVKLLFCLLIKKKNEELEIAWQLRVPAALPEGPGLIPTTPMVAHNSLLL